MLVGLPLLQAGAGDHDRASGRACCSRRRCCISACVSGCTLARSIVLCVAEKLWIGGELSERSRRSRCSSCSPVRRPVCSATLIVAKLRPSAREPNAFRLLGLRRAGGILRGVFCLCGADVRRHVVGRQLPVRLDRLSGTRGPLRQPALYRRIAGALQLAVKLYPERPTRSRSATVALHLAFNHRFGYYRDELYFIDCARHLAWGYVDQPPLAPLITWLTRTDRLRRVGAAASARDSCRASRCCSAARSRANCAAAGSRKLIAGIADRRSRRDSSASPTAFRPSSFRPPLGPL